MKNKKNNERKLIFHSGYLLTLDCLDAADINEIVQILVENGWTHACGYRLMPGEEFSCRVLEDDENPPPYTREEVLALEKGLY